jgi:hypothetical protein
MGKRLEKLHNGAPELQGTISHLFIQNRDIYNLTWPLSLGNNYSKSASEEE